jgi:ribonuclease P protein component
MLPKKNRVGTKAVEKIFKTGKSFHSPLFTFKFFNNIQNEKKISFIVSKNIVKDAVKRNRLRRLGYSVLQNFLTDFPAGIVGVFVFKQYQDDVLVIENEIKNILNKSR